MENEDLIVDWKDTVGLTIHSVEEYENGTFDDPVSFSIIRFTNGKFVIQQDQSYYTTSCGLVSEITPSLEIDIAQSKKIEY